MKCNINHCKDEHTRCFLDSGTPVVMNLQDRQKLWRLCAHHSEIMDRIQAQRDSRREVREVSWEESVVWETMKS